MTSYSPTFIALTPDKNEYSIVINDSERHYSKINMQWVMFRRKEHDLDIVLCNKITAPELKGHITTEMIKQFKSCVFDESYVPGILISPKEQSNSAISINDRILIPIIDESIGSIFSQNRTGDVLGMMQKQLTIENFYCSPTVTTKSVPISCEGYIHNTTETPVLVDVLVSARQYFSPGLKTYEDRVLSNILLLKNQQYRLSFTIPEGSYSIGVNTISATASFRSPGIPAPSYITEVNQQLIFIPLLIIATLSLTIITLSVILARRVLLKLKRPNNGRKK